MKIENNGIGCYNIYISKECLNNTILNDKEKIVNSVKNILFKLQMKLNLIGFYKVKVYVHKIIGLYIELIKLDGNELLDSLDLRIIVYMNEKFYFETMDYFIIENYNYKKYKDGKYYICIDENIDNIYNLVEFGRFVCGREVNKLLNNSINI